MRADHDTSLMLIHEEAFERTVPRAIFKSLPACSSQVQESGSSNIPEMHAPHAGFLQPLFSVSPDFHEQELSTYFQPIRPTLPGTSRQKEASTHDLQPCISPINSNYSAEMRESVSVQITAISAPPDAQSKFPLPRTCLQDLDWGRIRPVFEHLYIDNDQTLKQVMAELRRKHDFRATGQMYKTRIKQWGLEKNLKQHEVEHILGIKAQRRAGGKDTSFTLHGRRVDMQSVYRFQQRKKLKTSEAVANYVTGRSKECRDLRALTPPQNYDSVSWKTPDHQYENTLRAFGALFHGLVDTRYYWMESNEIVMPPSVLRGEVSDICSNLVASKNDVLNSMVVRKLALLMESIVHSRDAWIHCRLIFMLWIISTAGHPDIAKALLGHLKELVAATVDQACAQYRFVQHYSSLELSRAMKLAADMISLKANMIGEFHVENPAAFKLRSLEYDVFWRQREQGNSMSMSRAIDLLKRCHSILGPLAIETLAILRLVLEDFVAMQVEFASLRYLLDYLEDTKKLVFCDNPPSFTFDGQSLGMEAVSELACIYCRIGLHDAEAWIFERLLARYTQTASCLRTEYALLVHISRCSELHGRSGSKAWLQRKQKIENIWQAEVEAAAPTNELLSDQ